MRVLMLLATIAVIVLAAAVVIYGPTYLRTFRERHRLERERRRLEHRRFENQIQAEEEEAWNRRLRKDDK